jgi:1-acyl-sn-glycerol-3-phosphate acyltransferase
VLAVTGGLRVRGVGRLPATPCVIVANRGSRADTAALIAALPVRRRPVRCGGGSAGLLGAVRLLAAGHDVVIYPEEARSQDGSIAEFRPGAARLAAVAGVPLVPLGITRARASRPATGMRARARRAAVTVRVGMPVSADAALWVAVESGGAAEPAAVASDVVTRVTAVARAQVLTLAGPPNGDAEDDCRRRGSSWRARRRPAPGSSPRG